MQPPGGVVEFTCASLPLKPGGYSIGAVVRDTEASRILAWWDGETRLYVQPGAATEGQFHIPHSWRVIHAEDSAFVSADAGPLASELHSRS